jgi:hypothetical protein
MYKNTRWKDPGQALDEIGGAETNVIGVFNRDLILAGTPAWLGTAKFVDQNIVDNLIDAGFSAPFATIYDGGTKLACAYTYADRKALQQGGYETGYYHLAQVRQLSRLT